MTNYRKSSDYRSASKYGDEKYGDEYFRNNSTYADARQYRPGGDQILLPPSIIAPFAFGSQAIWLKERYIQQSGWRSDLYGSQHEIENYNRLAHVSGINASGIGSPWASHSRRTISQISWRSDAYGLQWASFSPRLLSPHGIFDASMPLPMVGGTRWLGVEGFEATRFGSRIIPEIQTVYPQGFLAPFGQAGIRNSRHLIKPPGWLTAGVQPEDRWGWALAFNSDQYITQVFDINSGLAPPPWASPYWTAVANRNKTIAAFGQGMTRYGEDASVFNNARVLAPDGIAAPAFQAGGMVADRVRMVAPDAMEPPYISGWGVVYNDARVLSPQGFKSQETGAGAVENTRRYFRYIGAFESEGYGTPMVADRVRVLGIEGRYSIAPPLVQLPEVKLHTRYVNPISFESYASGAAFLSIHWTLITPRWTPRDFVGQPSLRNVTPELRTKGRAADEFGTPLLRNMRAYVNAWGYDMALFGRAWSAYRNRTVPVQAGPKTDRYGQPKVVRIGAEPPFPQHIGPIGIPDIRLPSPQMNQQVLYVLGDDFKAFGQPRITANVIRVEPGFYETAFSFGFPALTYKTRKISNAGGMDFEVVFGEPHITPHTIHVPGANSSGEIEYIDSRAVFGIPRLYAPGTKRYVSASGAVATQYGTPSLDLKKHYIGVTGFNMLRLGWHEIPGTKEAEQFDSSDTMAIGQPTVKRPPYLGPQAINSLGFFSQAIGVTQIELLNRSLKMMGFSALRMGAPDPEENPYKYQSLAVHFPMPTIPTGAVMTRYGTAWVSHRVREVVTEGFEGLVIDYELENFDARMQVWKRGGGGGSVPPTPPARTIAPVGFGFEGVGVSDVKPGVHYIRPDGNADQYRKGAPDA